MFFKASFHLLSFFSTLVQYNELYSGLTLLLSRQPDNCLPLVQVREKYEQVVGKPFPINDRIRKTINKYCENIKVSDD